MFYVGRFITNHEHKYNSRQNTQFLREKANSTSHGLESIRILGPKIWDLLPNEMKLVENINSFKEKIKKWKVVNCPCRLCKVYVRGVGYL